jgi:hypothetical protein
MLPEIKPMKQITMQAFASHAKFDTRLLLVGFILTASCANEPSTTNTSIVKESGTNDTTVVASKNAAPQPRLQDTAAYERLSKHLANGDSSGRWPVKSIYPKPGAIFPYNRVVAYYGNLLSKGMGILGELPEDEMLNRLQAEVKKWQQADTLLPVIPALHYVAITAQGSPGREGRYILRMPFAQIDTVLRMAKRIDALVFVDLQVGLSTIQHELPMLEKYLMMPNVHLGIDPEFSMKTGARPGSRIGSYNAADINYVTQYLARLVNEHNIPPKILVIHRFTKQMVQGYKDITLRPEVQVVIDMDGWGYKAKKLSTYDAYIYREPVQFTGFKIFYKNDTKTDSVEMQPADVLKLKPAPVYIQYQ